MNERWGLVLEDTIVAHFDCRAGIFPSAFEAESLLLWRASDPWQSLQPNPAFWPLGALRMWWIYSKSWNLAQLQGLQRQFCIWRHQIFRCSDGSARAQHNPKAAAWMNLSKKHVHRKENHFTSSSFNTRWVDPLSLQDLLAGQRWLTPAAPSSLWVALGPASCLDHGVVSRSGVQKNRMNMMKWVWRLFKRYWRYCWNGSERERKGANHWAPVSIFSSGHEIRTETSEGSSLDLSYREVGVHHIMVLLKQ